MMKHPAQQSETTSETTVSPAKDKKGFWGLDRKAEIRQPIGLEVQVAQPDHLSRNVKLTDNPSAQKNKTKYRLRPVSVYCL